MSTLSPVKTRVGGSQAISSVAPPQHTGLTPDQVTFYRTRLGIAVVGMVGVGSLMFRGGNRNGALPWARLARLPDNQVALQLGAFLSLGYIVPVALQIGSIGYPQISAIESAPRRVLDLTCASGTAYIAFQNFRSQQAVRRVKYPMGTFLAGRLHTVAAGGLVALMLFESLGPLYSLLFMPAGLSASRLRGKSDLKDIAPVRRGG